jgi:hypothetical protein
VIISARHRLVPPPFRRPGTRRALLVALASLTIVLVACTQSDSQVDAQRPSNAPSDSESRLLAFAARHLSDEDLRATVPSGFDFDEVTRYGRDRHANPWVTVGVRMTGPVALSRVIYYVHPTADAATELYRDQVEITVDTRRFLARGPRSRHLPRPWSIPDVELPNKCGARGDGFIWCHSVRGRVYQLVQSAAAWPSGRDTITAEERRAADTLAEAFGNYLEGLPAT